MSSELAISATGLGKRYILHHEDPRESTFVESAGRFLTSPLRRFRELRGRAKHQEQFWALRNVDLEITSGEVVGLIERNGAPRATLLKVLSRITKPTAGRAEIHGTVRSLLEVGIGFHPELTGRENIFLNGAVLGMKKREIAARLDEIVSFSEVEQFLDTPVKRYSSGMFVRLAFAVAVHFEPDILLVDEVLSVGDASFQRRCIEKISHMVRGGRTVVIVSHNLQTIRTLTRRCIYMDQGTVQKDGPTEDVVDHYLDMSSAAAGHDLSARIDRTGSGIVRFTGVMIGSEDDRATGVAASGRNLTITLPFEASPAASHLHATVHITGALGERLATMSTFLTGSELERVPARGALRCTIPRLPLAPGHYQLELICAADEQTADWIQNAAILVVEPGDFFGSGVHEVQGIGRLLLDQEWHVEEQRHE